MNDNICRYCGKNGLLWIDVGTGQPTWKLSNNGIVHRCWETKDNTANRKIGEQRGAEKIGEQRAERTIHQELGAVEQMDSRQRATGSEGVPERDPADDGEDGGFSGAA